MKRSTFLIILFIGLGANSQAQITTDSLISDFYQLFRTNLDVKIPVKTILGKWTSSDSSKYQISFVEQNHMVILLPQSHLQPYGFNIDKDSIVASGSAPHWPPYYCFLRIIQPQTLEITYHHHGNIEPRRYVFRKNEP